MITNVDQDAPVVSKKSTIILSPLRTTQSSGVSFKRNWNAFRIGL
jgi:hypothetical protein